MPGRPLKRIPCDVCGKYVQDRREVVTERKVMCGACADGGYYTVKEELFLWQAVFIKVIEIGEFNQSFRIEIDGEAGIRDTGECR